MKGPASKMGRRPSLSMRMPVGKVKSTAPTWKATKIMAACPKPISKDLA